MVRVTAISYLNTIPFVYGLRNHPVSSRISLDFATPSQAAERLKSGLTDISIVPVAAIPEVENARIISDYCIGADAEVASVLLCSGKPLEQIKQLKLDVDSRTSVLLARVMCENYWSISPEYVSHTFGKSALDTTDSYIIIGDKAMEAAPLFDYVYDLAAEWIKYRNQPFVFACWTTNRDLDEQFLKDFNDALSLGVNNIEKSLSLYDGPFSHERAYDYLTRNISYPFGADKRKGLSDFWSLALEELKSKVRWFG